MRQGRKFGKHISRQIKFWYCNIMQPYTHFFYEEPRNWLSCEPLSDLNLQIEMFNNTSKEITDKTSCLLLISLLNKLVYRV